jgi:hypothetical protein
MVMFAMWSHLLPMNQLPQCLFANVVADISGPNADLNPLRERNFNQGITDHLDVAFKPSEGDTKRQKSIAVVEVNTIRDLDQRLPECDGKSMWEMLPEVASHSGDRHRLIIQADHKVTDSDTVVVTCRARDADKVQVLMKRLPLFVTDHYLGGWNYFKEGLRDHLMETFVRDANGHWIYRHHMTLITETEEETPWNVETRSES